MMSKPPQTHPAGHTQELEGKQDRMRQIISCPLDAIITMSDQGLITGWNPQAEIIFGWTKAEALGKKLSHLIIPKPLQKAHEEEFRRVRQSQQSQMLNQRVELSAIRKNGNEFPVELSMTPVMVGDRTQFCAFMRDLTEHKDAEACLKKAHQKAEALARLKLELAEAETPRRAAIIILETARKLIGWDSSWLDLWNMITLADGFQNK